MGIIRTILPDVIPWRNELRTRLEMIDGLLTEQGWVVSDRSCVLAEIDTKQSDFVRRDFKTVTKKRSPSSPA